MEFYELVSIRSPKTWSEVEELAASWQVPSGTLQKPRKGRQLVVCLPPAFAPIAGFRSFTISAQGHDLFSVTVQR